MKLICFPHYTCGALMCDIMNGTNSQPGTAGIILNKEHDLGKIGDSDSVLDTYEVDDLLKLIGPLPSELWIGTHCWPGILPLERFEHIINITTTTYRSLVYRWVRSYYHYYFSSEPWVATTGMDRVDKERETAKNYLVPFSPVFHPSVTNLEFSEIVDQRPSFQNLLKKHGNDSVFARWRENNSFLYDAALWSSDAVSRFHEAEFENKLKTFYVYQ